jgi:hypothetical protein
MSRLRFDKLSVTSGKVQRDKSTDFVLPNWLGILASLKNDFIDNKVLVAECIYGGKTGPPLLPCI